MKPCPKPKPRPEIFISALFIILHVSCGLCRHLNHFKGQHHAIRNFLNINHSTSSSPHSNDLKQPAIMNHSHTHQRHFSDSFESYLTDEDPVGDIANKTPDREAHSKSDLNGSDAPLINYDASERSPKDHFVFEYSVLSPSDYDVTEEDEDTSPHPGYNHTRVPLMDESEVWSLINEVVAKRNRIRRQSSLSSDPSDSNAHRRRKHKRRHRLLLKSRNSHSDGSQDGGRRNKKQRKNFILKSDSESHLITSANEIKKDWCRTVPFTHKVTASRCKTKVINNNFCYGQCNSFFIPQQRTSKGVAFQSYSNCKPDRLRWLNVTLECPDQTPPVVQRTVLMVESCRCIAMDEPNGDKIDRNIRHFTKNKGKPRSPKKP